MKCFVNLVQYVALGMILYRTDGDVICMVCAVALGAAAFAEGLNKNKEGET